MNSLDCSSHSNNEEICLKDLIREQGLNSFTLEVMDAY